MPPSMLLQSMLPVWSCHHNLRAGLPSPIAYIGFCPPPGQSQNVCNCHKTRATGKQLVAAAPSIIDAQH